MRVLTDTVPTDVNPPSSITTTFVYNPPGSVYSVKDGKDQITTFLYDASDLKTKMTYPNGDYQSWPYDPAKNLIDHVIVAAGNRIRHARTIAGLVPDVISGARRTSTGLHFGNDNRTPIGVTVSGVGKLYVPRFNARPTEQMQGVLVPFGD